MKQTTFFSQIINSSKKIALVMALLLTVCISYSFASPNDEVSGEIRTSFQKNFKNAQIIGSEVHQHITKLTFKMDEMVMFAFYNDNGELLAVTRNILSTQLPINLLISLKKDYSSYWITELFELTGDGQNSYYISLENANTKLTLHSNGNDGWEVYQKTARN